MKLTGWKSGYSSDGSIYSLLAMRGKFSDLLSLTLLMAIIHIAHCSATQALTLAEIQEQTGYTLLKSVLANNLPTGNGVPISQVEASSVASPSAPVYFPDATNPDFTAATDPFSEAITLIDASNGASNGTSGHATYNVGRYFYGNDYSFAPGANTVTVYEANHWLTNVLKVNGDTPAAHDFRVENFSWVGSYGNSTLDTQALGRFDYLINNNNITAVVGTNSSETPSALLSHSLNALSVGTTEGGNPTNPTTNTYFPGRNKPDLVAPGTLSSEASAIVASAATMLHESGADTEDSTESETMKAILMAGAVKDDLPSWNQSSDPITVTQPLDDAYGAGVLNVYNSYLIQTGGKFPGSATSPSTPVGIDGWDYGVSSNGSSQYYTFEVPVGSTAAELSIALTWNAKVTDSPGSGFSPNVTLDNLDLILRNALDVTVAESISGSAGSAENNVEHIYLTDLTEGLYTLELANLTSGGSRDFGLAWRMEPLFNTETADFDTDGSTTGVDFLSWQKNFGTYAGAVLSDGDGNGDADVDAGDLSIFEAEFGSTGGAATASAAIPEPRTLALSMFGLIILCQLPRFHWQRVL